MSSPTRKASHGRRSFIGASSHRELLDRHFVVEIRACYKNDGQAE